ncbi:hypothetical protein AVEN_156987-1 [Araneus ventricosus]|uniref:Uncharacterized protein n=1 Tax=Araneus ventricosus TaxID=182803 RepID=A0A4Y2P5N1_ARAVE|nr:hypothetical protein AVEN_156987-1 [Araneus ventricosus]
MYTVLTNYLRIRQSKCDSQLSDSRVWKRNQIRLRVDRRHHLQSICLQDVVLADQTDENLLGLSLVASATASTLQPRLSPKRFSSDDDDDDEMMSPTVDETATQRILSSWNWALIKRWDKCINIGGFMLKNKIVWKLLLR